MPDRIIRVGILTSDLVNKLTWPAEVFYRRLMSVADDYGRYDGRPVILKAQLYALKSDRVTEPDIAKWIGECREAGLVRVYTVTEKPFVEILNFGQRIQAKSKWPDPPSDENPPGVTVKHGDSPPIRESDSGSKSKTDSLSHTAGGASGFGRLVESLCKDGFPQAWQDWRAYRAEIGEPLTSYTAKQQILKCERWGAKRSVQIIAKAIENSWKNLREDHEMNYGPGGKAPAAPTKAKPPEPPPAWVAQLKAIWPLVAKHKEYPDPVLRLQITAAVKALPRDAWMGIQGDDYNTLNGFLKSP